ncbi:MAG: hypothetical protein AUH45_03380 [Gemmatimonadetes bacterium 13_1_40CM_69_22]|nr:MAG: hypothetical protein AUH45_03380 [Gemmatimonadetes bacterium 13_1_40CM_69_22]
MRSLSRALATLAVGFLALDALLFLYSGLSLGRPGLIVSGAACGLAAVLVVLSWRRYRRAIAELEQARREMQAEVQSLRELLHRKQLHN